MRARRSRIRSLLCSTLALAAGLSVLASIAGCPASSPDDKGPIGDCGVLEATLEIEGADGTFRPLSESAPVEAFLVLGFQGFKFVIGRVRLNQDPPTTAGSVVLALDGARQAVQPFSRLELHHEGAELVSDEILLFFNDEPLPSLVGRTGTLTLRMGRDQCAATTGGRVHLNYRPECLQEPSGAIVCTEDGGSPPDAASSDGGAL